MLIMQMEKVKYSSMISSVVCFFSLMVPSCDDKVVRKVHMFLGL